MPNMTEGDRWVTTGTNQAGDKVYERNIGTSSSSGTAATSSSQMSKQELQALAAERGLPTSGTKKQLIERLSGLDV